VTIKPIDKQKGVRDGPGCAAQSPPDPLTGILDHRFVALRQYDGEFVSPYPRHHVASPENLLQNPGGRSEQGMSHRPVLAF
jgi:hypothetical protein